MSPSESHEPTLATTDVPPLDVLEAYMSSERQAIADEITAAEGTKPGSAFDRLFNEAVEHSLTQVTPGQPSERAATIRALTEWIDEAGSEPGERIARLATTVLSLRVIAHFNLSALAAAEFRLEQRLAAEASATERPR